MIINNDYVEALECLTDAVEDFIYPDDDSLATDSVAALEKQLAKVNRHRLADILDSKDNFGDY